MILVKKYWLYLCTLALIASIFLGYNAYSKRELLKRELNLDGLFINIKGVSVKTTDTNLFEEKPYEKIIIEIPSLSSELDDQTANTDKKDKPNRVINREKFDKGFIDWLKAVYDEQEAKKYTKNIQLWYRDIKVIDKKF